MNLSTVFEYQNLPYNQNHEAHLLLKLTAPKMDVSKRKPLRIVTLVDVSSSMMGPKLDYTKKSLLKMVDNMMDGDMLSIVTFSHVVTEFVKPTVISSMVKESLRTQIGKLYSSGSTDLLGALSMGYRIAESMDGAARVILLTDGQPTAGDTNVDSICKRTADLYKSDLVTLSCFGYGSDHDAGLLDVLSTKGKGNYVYITGPDEALVAFGREFGGLLSRFASNLAISLAPDSEFEILEVCSDIDVEDKKDHVVCSVPDIYSEEVRRILYRVRMKSRDKFFPRAVTVGKISLSYTKFDASAETMSHNVQYEFSKSGTPVRVDEVVEQMDLVKLLNTQKAAEEAAKRGDFLTAQSVLRNATFDSSKSAGFTNFANTTSTNYASAGAYTSNSHANMASMKAFKTSRVSMTGAAANAVNSLTGAVEGAAIGAAISNFTDGAQQGQTSQVQNPQAASGTLTVSGNGTTLTISSGGTGLVNATGTTVNSQNAANLGITLNNITKRSTNQGGW
jgi:Mg-chelatase subunit ChlD